MEVSDGSSVETIREPVNVPISRDDATAAGDSVVRQDTKSEVRVRATSIDAQDAVKDGGEQAGDEKTPPIDRMQGESPTVKRPSSPLDDRQAEYSKLQERLSRLEDRVGDVETGIKRIEDSDNDGSDSDASHSYTSGSLVEIEIEEKEGGLSHPLRTIPEVRECNWEQFKNRFCEKDASYAIESLVAGARLQDEIMLEQLRRYSPEQRARFGTAISDLMENCDPDSQVGDLWIQRIRIQSLPVLRILAKVAGQSWSTKPRTFLRPFSALIYFHDKMKDEFSKLKSKFGGTESSESPVKSSTTQDQVATQIPEPNAFTAPVGDALELSDELSIDALVSSKEAFEDMRCYVNFVDEKLIPLYHQFDKPDDSHPQKIRFDDLWYLFRIGELIYIQNLSESDTSRLSSVEQRVWRLCSLFPPPVNYRVKLPKDKKGILQLPQTTVSDPTRKAKVNCYYIDSNGESYGAVTKEFTIPYFEGERDIRELDVYPLRFAEDRERIVEERQLEGRNFMRYEKERPLSYNGWTLISDPKGNPINNLKGEVIKYPEHIDSDVIVDFKEAFQTYPPWNPEFGPRRPQRSQHGPPPPPPPPGWRGAPPPGWNEKDPDSGYSVGTDHFSINRWSDSKRSELVSTAWEIVVENDCVDSLERDKNLETDQYLVKRGGKQTISEDDIILLPKRLFAYALRERKFVHVDVRYLKPITEHIDGFKSLKIDDDHRRMIQSLVHFHFKKKAVEKQGLEIGTQDLIRGKGKGLVILLHGVPGVGKTATAEAVAQANRKPLFPITCGDLGFTPESLENSLNEIFRLAHLWDCVLLLDEADIFLSQRTKSDLQRNALVSVFLRILEYFNGILFLTTNRPGTLDEAVKSRVHMSLYYSPLREAETHEIFKLNLHRLKEIEKQRSEASGEPALYIFEEEILTFAREHFRKHADGTGRWNGRQIRNAFQIAASLAHYDGELNPGAQRQLRSSHFQTVDDATTKYDQFRAAVLGGLDAEIAHEREERYDDFEPPDSTKGGSRRRSYTFQGEKVSYHAHSNSQNNTYQNASPLAQYGKTAPPQTMNQMAYNQQTPPPQRVTSTDTTAYHAGQPQPLPEHGPYIPLSHNQSYVNQSQPQHPHEHGSYGPRIQNQDYGNLPQSQPSPDHGSYGPLAQLQNYGATSQPYVEYAARKPSPDASYSPESRLQSGNQPQVPHAGTTYGNQRPHQPNYDRFGPIQ